MCINNKDVLGTIRESNGFLKVNEIKITQDEVLIAELKAMRKNPNRTVIDMERLFNEYYPSNVHGKSEFDYLYPVNYNDSYVSRAKYPTMISAEEYCKRISDIRRNSQWSYLDSPEAKDYLDKLKEGSLSLYKQEILKRERLVQKDVDLLKENMKKHFKPERFIFAYNYYKKVREISHDPKVKLVTTDTLGWTDFSYKVNDDITVMMKTNFGYGSSSYFFSNIMYKGVSILPYTAVVKYFYVKWTDFIRYTNRYAPCRDNWGYALHFVADVANLAKHDPKSFLEKWVVSELKEMMSGLRKVMDSNDAELAKYLNFKNEVSLGSYSLVRNCYNSDITEYRVLPQEKIMAFKAEKITGCLYLLENLMQFRTISSYVNKCIEEIKSMNREIIPDIKSHRVSISLDIKRLQKKLDSINFKIKEKTPKLEKHQSVIKLAVDKMNMENGNPHITYSVHDYEIKYISLHPEYKALKNEISDLNQEAQEKKNEIMLRQSFDDQLEKCLKRISNYLEIAC